MAETTRCQSCQNIIPVAARFCPHCGLRGAVPSPISAESPRPSEAPLPVPPDDAERTVAESTILPHASDDTVFAATEPPAPAPPTPRPEPTLSPTESVRVGPADSQHAGSSRRRLATVVGGIAALVVVGLVVALAGGRDGADTVAAPVTLSSVAPSDADRNGSAEAVSETPVTSTTTPTTTTGAVLPATTTTTSMPASLSQFEGVRFDVGVPIGWSAKRVEEPVRGAANPTEDSTWVRDGEEIAIVRVDVTFGRSDNDPVAASEAVRGELGGRPSYVELEYQRTTLTTASGSYPAVRWEYLLEHPSRPVLTHNVNYFLDVGDRSIAMLTRASADEFRSHAALFDDVRSSLVIH